jgi:HEAT repeat protein
MPATPKERGPELLESPERGDWNERIHAVNGLGAMGPGGLPGLERAMGDFDWQVRFTALHWLGRHGDAAIAQLRRALREDPCRVIRISALHWLGSLGGSGISAVREAAEDPESGILRLSAWYWLRKQGAASAFGDRGPLAAEDLNVCADFYERPSPQVVAAWKRLASVPSGEQLAALADLPDGAVEVSVLGRRQEEIRSLLEAESLPPPQGLPERPAGQAAPADLLATAEIDALLFGPGRLKTKGTPEALPPSPPPVEMKRDPAIDAAALLDADPVLNSPPADPLPPLLELLGSAQARVRSRAADELGQLGAAAAPAVAPLRQLLKDQSPRVRASAALALGNIGPAADPAVKALVGALQDPSAAVRYGATLALSRIGTPSARAAFRRYLRREAEAETAARPGKAAQNR